MFPHDMTVICVLYLCITAPWNMFFINKWHFTNSCIIIYCYDYYIFYLFIHSLFWIALSIQCTGLPTGSDEDISLRPRFTHHHHMVSLGFEDMLRAIHRDQIYLLDQKLTILIWDGFSRDDYFSNRRLREGDLL